MPESIVVVRLTRNLRYKLTYVKIFESYLDSTREPELVTFLQALIQAQQAAIAPLSRYLRHLDAPVQDLELDDKLLAHAADRDNTQAKLRFIYDGLRRAVAWYKTQLMDRQMTRDPELLALLIELGELDAAKLWYAEAIMGMLRIPTKLREKDWENQERVQPQPDVEWQPRLVEDVGRPMWQGKWAAHVPRLKRPPAEEPD